MILCLDAGNSRLKAGLWEHAEWVRREAVDYADFDAWASSLPADIRRVVACNVAGAEIAQRIGALSEALASRMDWLRSDAEACDVRSGYSQPEQLGADRWAALIAARGRQLHVGGGLAGNAMVVVMAGTATTIDGLDADGYFRGGLILPGISLMRQALAQGTAQLPHASGDFSAWPTDTAAAIVSGSLDATAGAIERMQRRLSALSAAPVHCLLGGGAADALRERLELPLTPAPDLVLEGLLRFAQAPRDE
jgi:type III pantothenate kinase